MWKENSKGEMNLKEGVYWVNSALGVVLARFSNWSYKFQSLAGNDEGMCGFEVSHYQEIIKPEAPE